MRAPCPQPASPPCRARQSTRVSQIHNSLNSPDFVGSVASRSAQLVSVAYRKLIGNGPRHKRARARNQLPAGPSGCPRLIVRKASKYGADEISFKESATDWRQALCFTNGGLLHGSRAYPRWSLARHSWAAPKLRKQASVSGFPVSMAASPRYLTRSPAGRLNSCISTGRRLRPGARASRATGGYRSASIPRPTCSCSLQLTCLKLQYWAHKRHWDCRLRLEEI